MKEKPLLSAQEAVANIHIGQTIMLGGFMGCGTPPLLVRALQLSGTKNLVLVGNDCGYYKEDGSIATGASLNIKEKQFSKVITSHIGLNPEMQRQMIAEETEVQLVPQGSLAERIRAAGSGLGGILTATGVGTEVAEGKRVIEVDGKQFLLELPLAGDVALIRAHIADKAGNLVYARSARNLCPLMAAACTFTIVEADHIVEVGSLDPEIIVTPSIFVNLLVQGRKEE